ncbi:MAG: hypothetical protein AAFP84_10900 [Actinomycetota bacterium]
MRVGALGALLSAVFVGLAAAALALEAWLPVAAAVIGGVNGVLSGWRGIYDWSCRDGFIAFVLDSTWSIVMTAAAVFANGVALVQRDAGYVPQLSERKNQHVHERGFMPRKGFAITLGNVIGGAGDPGLARKRKLVTDHESVHCWQARWFGPLYPVLYVGWLVLGGAVGAVWWAAARRGDSFPKVVETASYYLNPFEWWAYSRHGYWPPKGKVADMGWQRPCCRPLAEVRAPATEPAGPVTR